jgi:hypothetical protein
MAQGRMKQNLALKNAIWQNVESGKMTNKNDVTVETR